MVLDRRARLNSQTGEFDMYIRGECCVADHVPPGVTRLRFSSGWVAVHCLKIECYGRSGRLQCERLSKNA
jgi:hypothetical protein